MKSDSNRACPSCGTPIPLSRALLGNTSLKTFGSQKYAFRCKSCGARLIISQPRAGTLIAALVVLVLMQQQYGLLGWQTWGTLAVILVMLSIWSLSVLRVRLATGSDPDQPPP